MTTADRASRLLATDRWRPLDRFVERWYASPIGPGDGHSSLELEQATARAGATLPAALTEWFELVGRRLRSAQDSPLRLDQLAVVDGAIDVWTENQGVWAIITPVDAGDDPICRVNDATFASPDAPLSRTLLGMLVSDTLVGAWAGSHLGPLGPLHATVRGGYVEDFTDDQVKHLRSTYAALSYPVNPYFPEAYRGDDATVIRLEDVAIQWMTATDDAFVALDAALGLRPSGGEHEVVVAFERLTDAQVRYLTREHGLPDIGLLRRALGGVGQIGMAVGGDSPRFHIRTREPHRVRDRILSALPDDMRPHLVIAARPIAISVFNVLYPDDRAAYVLPP
jgi:hypothetical protein